MKKFFFNKKYKILTNDFLIEDVEFLFSKKKSFKFLNQQVFFQSRKQQQGKKFIWVTLKIFSLIYF